jgi:hypothetical protein
VKRPTAVLVGMLMLLAGCGDRPGYDASAVEGYLLHMQNSPFANLAIIDKAKCPAHHDLSEGMTVRCTITVSGSKIPYRVTLTNVNDDPVTVSAKPDGVVLSRDKLRQVIGLSLPQGAAKAAVDCGGPFMVAHVGQSLKCQATLGSQVRTFTVKVKDTTGRVSVVSS